MSVIAELIDKMTGIIVDGFANTANKADFENAKKNVREFLELNINKLTAWAEANPGRRPPIYCDVQTGRVVWLTREQQRRMMRIAAKTARKGHG